MSDTWWHWWNQHWSILDGSNDNLDFFITLSPKGSYDMRNFVPPRPDHPKIYSWKLSCQMKIIATGKKGNCTVSFEWTDVSWSTKLNEVKEKIREHINQKGCPLILNHEEKEIHSSESSTLRELFGNQNIDEETVVIKLGPLGEDNIKELNN